VEAEEEHGGPFVVDVPDVFTQAFVIEKDSKRFPKAADGDTRCSTTTPHPTSSRPIPAPQDCGHACHVAVKAKDHIFHPYQKR
jgi:hypothetical protein